MATLDPRRHHIYLWDERMVQVLQFLLLLSKVSTVGDVKKSKTSALCRSLTKTKTNSLSSLQSSIGHYSQNCKQIRHDYIISYR